MPDISIKDRLQKLYVWFENMLPSLEWSLMDYFYFYRPSLNPNDWIAPFKSKHAYCIGMVLVSPI